MIYLSVHVGPISTFRLNFNELSCFSMNSLFEELTTPASHQTEIKNEITDMNGRELNEHQTSLELWIQT